MHHKEPKEREVTEDLKEPSKHKMPKIEDMELATTGNVKKSEKLMIFQTTCLPTVA